MKRNLEYIAILFVVLFWMLVPLIAQVYYGYSAITVSFAITVFYFVVWKLFENWEKFLDR